MSGWNAENTSAAGNVGAATTNGAGRLIARRIAANMASIEGVPKELLGGVDREWAIAWARKGYDVYACRDEDGAWYLWLATRSMKLGVAHRGPMRQPKMPSRH